MHSAKTLIGKQWKINNTFTFLWLKVHDAHFKSASSAVQKITLLVDKYLPL